jgi:YaaC-like Protein
MDIRTLYVRDDGLSAPPAERFALFERIGTRHGAGAQTYYLMPAVGSKPEPMHPLMSWWCVLFSLSMLARYQPAEWVSHIDVDQSVYAVAIEQVMTSSLSAVPELIMDTIRDVS